MVLRDHPAASRTIAGLAAGLERHGFTTTGSPPKAISDALRTELRRGRVQRVARGTHRLGRLPRTTRWRAQRAVEQARLGRGSTGLVIPPGHGVPPDRD